MAYKYWPSPGYELASSSCSTNSLRLLGRVRAALADVAMQKRRILARIAIALARRPTTIIRRRPINNDDDANKDLRIW